MSYDFKPIDLINSAGVRVTAWTIKQFEESLETGGYRVAPYSEIKQSGVVESIVPHKPSERHGGRSKESKS